MKSNAFTGIFLCSAALLACASEAERTPTSDPPVVQPEPVDPVDKEKTPIEPEPPPACTAPLAALSCETLKPPPTTSTAIASFVKEGAIPIRCGDGDRARWDVRPLIDLSADAKIFMVGEVHGTNEIGITSAVLLEQLASNDRVNVLGFEIPMDYEPYLQHFVESGSDDVTEELFSYLAPNMFGNILTRMARKVVENGHSIRVAAVDIPASPELPIAELESLASQLTTQKSTVLDTLPNASATVAEADAYYEHIMASKSAICSELTTAECDRLDAMTHALWATLTRDDSGGSDVWFERREVVIYYNMRTAMPATSDRMFLHMGAAHTNKYEFSAGSRMTHEYALTKDKVFSVAPAWGDDSVLFYGDEIEMDAEPAMLSAALTDAPPDPTFVSTTRPNAACEENPFGLEQTETTAGSRAETYDGYIHYGKLTPETKPSATKLDATIPVATGASGSKAPAGKWAAALLRHRAKVEAKERAALRARHLSR